jgi:hypothetical protein
MSGAMEWPVVKLLKYLHVELQQLLAQSAQQRVNSELGQLATENQAQ